MVVDTIGYCFVFLDSCITYNAHVGICLSRESNFEPCCKCCGRTGYEPGMGGLNGGTNPAYTIDHAFSAADSNYTRSDCGIPV